MVQFDTIPTQSHAKLKWDHFMFWETAHLPLPEANILP